MADRADTTEETRVVIVARYASVRAGLHTLLLSEAGVSLLGDTPDGDALGPLLPTLRPNAVLLDTLGSGGADELSRTLAALNKEQRAAPALVVLGEAPERDLGKLSRAGLPGWGYLPREADGPQILRAVRGAAAGLIVLDAALPFPPFVAGDGANSETSESLFPGESLTPRETEVLQLMAEGLPNKIIATRLGISLHTAKFHVAQILGKLDAESRTEAVTIGARRGYVVL